MKNFLMEHIAWIWFTLAVIFFSFEALTFNLTTLWFGLPAIVMIFLSFLPISIEWQILIFLIFSLLLLFLVRPFAVKKFKIGSAKTNIDSIIGKKAVVTKSIHGDIRGEVRVDSVLWSAKSIDNSKIAIKTECTVEAVSGVTLLVREIKK